MSKILALDLGEQWVGVALSDASRILAKPLITIKPPVLVNTLRTLIVEHRLEVVVVGYPKTMRGTESDQTRKALATHELLKKQFANITFILWDERLSSKRAETPGTKKTSEEKQRSHARAAAFILDSYLTYLSSQQG
jgi:putative Holliday junction resolvase